MSYTKTIICLAKSYKTSGRCIAGRELTSGGFGDWVRPISNRSTHEINGLEMRCRTGGVPSLLDLITIKFSRHQPHRFQTENHLIDANTRWSNAGKTNWNTIQQLAENISGPLWHNGNSTFHGLNDKIPESIANGLKSSLVLIKPNKAIISVRSESQYSGNYKQAVRANFILSQQQYIIKVTDPVAIEEYNSQGIEEYSLSKALFCISLGEFYQGYAFKLVAGIFTP